MKFFHFFITVILALECNAQFDITYDYGTYLGRSGEEYTRGLECYQNGKCFIYGSTSSVSFYNDNAFQEDYGGGAVDGFYSLFTEEGELEYSSFFGGSDNESIYSMDQKNGYYALTGFTSSPDFPVTSGSHQEEISGDQDVFLALFTDSHELIWCTFFGGIQNEGNPRVALDEELNVYLSGETGSSDLGTPGVHQETPNHIEFGPPFLAKFSFSGELEWCTYFDGNNITRTSDLTISDSGEQLYLGGITFADDQIAQAGHQTVFGGGDTDGYLAAFNSENGTLNWSSYFGGDGTEFFYDIEFVSNNIVITGTTTSQNNIASQNAYQEELQGFSDGYLAKFDSEGNIQWSSYFGGEDTDELLSISIMDNTLVALGRGFSNSGLAFGNPIETENESGDNYSVSFLSSFDLDSGDAHWSTYVFSGCENLRLLYLTSSLASKIVLGGNSTTNGTCVNWITEDAFQVVHTGSPDEAALLYFTNNVLKTEELASHPLLIWPNPVWDELQFSLPGNSSGALQIINTSGSICTESYIQAGIQKIWLQDLSPGMYFIRISTEKGTYRSKFIKL